MTKPATVRVPDGLLRCARERAHVDIASAAERVEHSEADLNDWEGGNSDPPLSALRALAAHYNVPLSAFLLSTPKHEENRSVDRRTLAGIAHPKTTATEWWSQLGYDGKAKAAANIFAGQRIIQVCYWYTRGGQLVSAIYCSNATSNGVAWAPGGEVTSAVWDSLDPFAPQTIFHVDTARINPGVF